MPSSLNHADARSAIGNLRVTSSSFFLPLVIARNRLRDHYHSASFEFTLDGNLIGDIGRQWQPSYSASSCPLAMEPVSIGMPPTAAPLT